MNMKSTEDHLQGSTPGQSSDSDFCEVGGCGLCLTIVLVYMHTLYPVGGGRRGKEEGGRGGRRGEGEGGRGGGRRGGGGRKGREKGGGEGEGGVVEINAVTKTISPN